MQRLITFLALLAAAGASANLSPASAQQLASAKPETASPRTQELLTTSVMPVETAAKKQMATVKAASNLRAGTVLHSSDLIVEGEGASPLDLFVGMELKRAVYMNKPLSPNDVGLPTVVQRNAIVTLESARGPLVITTEGRALDAGAIGETVRVMNLSSKIILTATITGPNKAITK